MAIIDSPTVERAAALRARDVLGPSGPLAGSLAGYEDRPGQLAMTEAVERALAHERVLVCEAGTGTGKTLAYLVPAILSGKKIVVSTATRALQDQIFSKNLPLIRDKLGLRVSAALVKGLSNYLCRRRFSEYRASPEAGLPGAARAIAAVEEWAARTETGDLADLSGFSEDEPVFHEIASSSETRLGTGCAFFDSCFVTRMKREAEAARLLIVNHHLFFADLALRGPHAGAALPDYDAVIFDEAHQLEDIATDFFGVRVSSARVLSMLRDAERAFLNAGITDKLTRKGEGQALIELAREAAARFFAEVATAAARRGGSAAGLGPASGADGLGASTGATATGKVAIERDFWSGEVRASYHRLDAALEAVAAFAETRQTSEAVDLIAHRSAQIRVDLAAVEGGAVNQVAWAEGRARSVSIGASPIEIAGILKGRLFAQVPAAVLTSATLTTQGVFSFLRSRLGLEGDELVIEELEVPSPFDYRARALVYVPADLPDPGDPAWLEAARLRIAALIDASGGGAFVLCTSRRSMHALQRGLDRRPGRPILVQGDAPKGALLERFRGAGDAVLVATMSFWEGVDVVGRALRLIVIDKIPFQVPTDPIVLARAAAIEAAGKNPFTAYHVPSAAITLKQGFGRLIRSRKDAGVVAILDRRIHTKGYGRVLLGSLPPARRTDDLEETLAFATRLASANWT